MKEKGLRVRSPEGDFEVRPAVVERLAEAGPADVVILQPNEMHGFYEEDANLNLYTRMLGFFDKYIGADAVPAAGSGVH